MCLLHHQPYLPDPVPIELHSLPKTQTGLEILVFPVHNGN